MLGKNFYAKKLEKINPDEFFFGAFLKENLVGTVAFYRHNKMAISHKYTLWGMYIQPLYRQYHIGKLLLETALSNLKELIGCKIINLTVRTTNKAALSLYQSCGFKTWRVEPSALMIENNPHDLSHMALSL